MTKINRIVFDGFKSFAKRTEIVFSDGFNCVLGPNGSGKSNLIDGLCFVLGRLSSKSMRAEKLSNLIYNGGKTKTPAKSAEVAIYFDNTSKIFPTEDKEIKISRAVKGDGQSDYRINGKKRTRQQILDLLSLAKIDPNGHNIILQGDIMRFVDMHPEERRKLIEEIAGISIYEDKKQKAVRELDKVEEKLKEADIILAERETHLKELKKDRDQALKYKGLNEKIRDNKATYINIQLERKGEEKAAAEKKADKELKEIDGIKAKIGQIQGRMQKIKSDIAGVTKDIEEKGEKDQLAIMKDAERLRIDIATASGRMDNIRQELERIKARKEGLKTAISDTEGKIASREKDKKDIVREKGEKEKELKLVESKIDEFRKRNKLDNIADIEKEVSDLDEAIEKMQKDALELKSREHELLRKKDKLELQVQSVDERIDKVLQVEKENEEQISALKRQKEEFRKATLELSTLTSKDSSFASQIATARSKLTASREELSKLEARMAGMRERMLSDTAVRGIMGQAGKIKGVLGTVSELASSDSKYSLALEIAAGNKIKSIVVETDKVAAECIKFLKDNKLGVATFLPLNKIKGKDIPQSSRQHIKKSGALGFAKELVKYSPKYENVFSYVLGDTIIVDSIDNARGIGVGEIRMATLDGDLVEVSGAMQGGFRQRQKGGLGFSQSDIESEVKKQESIVADMTAVLEKLESDRKENLDRVDNLRQFKANLEGEIIKVEKSLHLDSADMDANKKVKLEFKKEIGVVDKDLDTLRQESGKKTRELTDIKIRKEKLRQQISSLRNPTLVAELNAFEQKRQELKEKLVLLGSELKNIDDQILNILTPEIAGTSKIIRQHDKEELEFTNESKAIKDKLVNLAKDLAEKEKKQLAFQSQFKGLIEKRNKLQEDYSKEEKKAIMAENDRNNAQSKLSDVGLDAARLKAEYAALEKEFEPYKGATILKGKSEAEIKKEISDFEKMVENIGAVNMRALDIYDDIEKEYKKLLEKKEKLKSERQDVLLMMNEIETKKRELFVKTFDAVRDKFKGIFSELSTKGEAELTVENKENPFEGGVGIKVRIAGSRFLDIRSLSGGEKTLTALAFIFCIQEYEPAFFYILDEVDAALDKHNAEMLSKRIRMYSEKSQYIVISHNDGVITSADNLYGVSINEHGISQVTSLKI